MAYDITCEGAAWTGLHDTTRGISQTIIIATENMCMFVAVMNRVTEL